MITGRKRTLAGTAYSAVIQEPSTMEEALSCEDSELWLQAMDEEMASLLANNTWMLEVDFAVLIQSAKLAWCIHSVYCI